MFVDDDSSSEGSSSTTCSSRTISRSFSENTEDESVQQSRVRKFTSDDITDYSRLQALASFSESPAFTPYSPHYSPTRQSESDSPTPPFTMPVSPQLSGFKSKSSSQPFPTRLPQYTESSLTEARKRVAICSDGELISQDPNLGSSTIRVPPLFQHDRQEHGGDSLSGSSSAMERNLSDMLHGEHVHYYYSTTQYFVPIFLSLYWALLSPYILLGISYEVSFFAVFCMTLCLWVRGLNPSNFPSSFLSYSSTLLFFFFFFFPCTLPFVIDGDDFYFEEIAILS